MNRKRILTGIAIGVGILAIVYTVATFSQTFTPLVPNGIAYEANNPAFDKMVIDTNGWNLTTGGYQSGTHYSRMRVKLPEKFGVSPSSFYMKSVIVLPSDFYDRLNSGFRVQNTDNFTTVLNGVTIGAKDQNEYRIGIWFWTNKLIQIRGEHETVDDMILYQANERLPVGEHTLEFWGDLAKVAPWGYKVDGALIASGNAMLSTSSTLPSERVITRIVTGIDGAWQANSGQFSLAVKSFTFSDAPPSDGGTITPTVFTPTNTMTSTPTATRTPTKTPTITFTPTITNTPTKTPVSIGTPTYECLLFPAHNNLRICVP